MRTGTPFSGKIKIPAVPVLMILTLFVTLQGCEDELSEDTVVLPEAVLFVSGESVRLAGRLISSGNLKIEDHGFHIDMDQSFSSPLVISLGQRTAPGRFIGDTTFLKTSTDYFWRPFVTVGGQILLGEASTFRTLTPLIKEFSPKVAVSGQFLEITGGNFTSDVRVFFGSTEAEIRQITAESIIQAVVPPISDSKFVDIRVVAQGQELISAEKFEFVVGKWEEVGTFVQEGRAAQTMGFVSGSKFIFGFGFLDGSQNERLWSFDHETLQWSEFQDPPPWAAAPFATEGYFGSGNEVLGFGLSLGNQLRYYDESTNQFEVVSEIPFPVYRAIAYRIGQKLFVFGGFSEGLNPVESRRIYEYNITTDEWTFRGSSPMTTYAELPSFKHDQFVYFLAISGALYRFDSETFGWEFIEAFPGSGIEENGVSVVVGERAYIGAFPSSRSLWEYRIESNTWEPKIGFTGDFFVDTVRSWEYAGVVYVLKNPQGGDNGPMKLWTFKPEEF